jgi:hypothetical protein
MRATAAAADAATTNPTAITPAAVTPAHAAPAHAAPAAVTPAHAAPAAVTPAAVTPAHADAPPSIAPPAPIPGGRPPRRVLRGVAIGALIALGVVCVGGGGTLLIRELTRGATSAEATAAAQQEVATRWQRLQASQIFPATIRYMTNENIFQYAHRVGIAPAASCQAALDPAVSQSMKGLGCTVVLRATYTDYSGALVATVGAAVLASPQAAATAVLRFSAGSPLTGVRAVAFSGTTSDLFDSAGRASFGTPVASGPYVFFYSAGYVTGQPSAGNPELTSLGQGLLIGIEHILTSHGKPCAMTDIRC